MRFLKSILGFSSVAGAGILFILASLAFSALSMAVTCLVVYFFLAAGGVFPPLDFIPFIPYI
jgi:hypothetical protein